MKRSIGSTPSSFSAVAKAMTAANAVAPDSTSPMSVSGIGCPVAGQSYRLTGAMRAHLLRAPDLPHDDLVADAPSAEPRTANPPQPADRFRLSS